MLNGFGSACAPERLQYRRVVGTASTGDLNLKQVAASLGVHYMTAYRYVRTGRLPGSAGRDRLERRSRRPGCVRTLAPASFGTSGQDELGAAETNRGAAWRARLRRTLASGDETGAWRVLEQALAAGHPPAECYLDLLVGAIDDISGRSSPPEAPIAEEYLAVATATRLVARLGARFRRPGRSRGTVVFGAPLGEHHTLAISVVADLVRLAGFSCLELGADVPPEAFAGAAAGAYRLIAVGVGVTRASHLDALSRTVHAVHDVDAAIPVIRRWPGGQPGHGDGHGSERVGV